MLETRGAVDRLAGVHPRRTRLRGSLSRAERDPIERNGRRRPCGITPRSYNRPVRGLRPAGARQRPVFAGV